MYHAIVKRFALQNFLRVNRKDYAAILKSCSPDVHHRFGGHHAWVASGTIVKRWGDGLNDWAGWLRRSSGSSGWLTV